MNEQCRNYTRLTLYLGNAQIEQDLCRATGENSPCSGFQARCIAPIFFRPIYGVKERGELRGSGTK